jgi:hypothetical protein
MEKIPSVLALASELSNYNNELGVFVISDPEVLNIYESSTDQK